MAMSMNSVSSASSNVGSYTSNSSVPADPYGVTPPSAYSADSYASSNSGVAPAGLPAAPQGGMMSALMGKLGLGSLLGAAGGGFLGFKYLLPKVALRFLPAAEAAAPPLLMRLGVIGGAALAGGWLLNKLMGHKTQA